MAEVLLQRERTEKASDTDVRGGWDRLAPSLVYSRLLPTRSHNIHLKLIRLVRRFLLKKRKKSLDEVICCYMIISTELKEKQTLEQDALFCCVIISSGLKES